MVTPMIRRIAPGCAFEAFSSGKRAMPDFFCRSSFNGLGEAAKFEATLWSVDAPTTPWQWSRPGIACSAKTEFLLSQEKLIVAVPRGKAHDSGDC